MKLEETSISHLKFSKIIENYCSNWHGLSEHKQSILRKKINKDLGLIFKWRMFFEDHYWIEDKHRFMISKIKYDL
jgi:hypothetical protein